LLRQKVEQSRCTSLLMSCSLRYSLRRVAWKTPTSIILLTVLLGGTITPTGLCTLMCEGHSRAESHRQCFEPSDGMPGMVHDHSGMNHSGVEDMSPAMVSQSCQTNCVASESLKVSRKVVPQVTVVQTGAVVLNTTAKSLAPDPAAAWSSDSGPPGPPTACISSFIVLRI
jgi:hypothetical protein